MTSDVVKGKDNTIVVHGLYFDGYDMEITFNRKDVLEPLLKWKNKFVALQEKLSIQFMVTASYG